MSRPLHELPLVAFTTLAIAGAGILAAWPIGLLTGIQGDPARDARWSALLLGVSLAVSLAHLGRTRRFPLALGGLGRSALSNEVLIAAVTFGAALVLLAVAAWGGDTVAARVEGGTFRPDSHGLFLMWLRAGTAALGCAFLVSLAFVYRLPAAPTWNGAVLAAPIVCGWLFGAVWHSAFAPLPVVAPALVLILIDSLILAARWRRLAAARGRPAHPRAFARRSHLFLLRFVVLDVATAALVVIDGHAAIVAAAAGMTLDRLTFYTLAVHRTIEWQVEDVEGVIGGNAQREDSGIGSQDSGVARDP